MNTILITGASSGIGKASAKYFAEQGWNVIATVRVPEKETEFSQLENVITPQLDVEIKETIQKAVSEGINHFGEIDVVLNNAGYAAMGIFETATDEQIQRQFNVNVFGVMQTTRAILPHFRAKRRGLIINISSMQGRVAFPTLSLDNASKFAVEGFTESLSYELASQNIRVKLVEPGSVNTDFTGRSMDFLSDRSLTDYNSYFDGLISKIGDISETSADGLSPQQVAEVIYQAATDESNQLRYIIGNDAKVLQQKRKQLTDEEFMSYVTRNYP